MDKIKAGAKTSEFWMSLVGAVLLVANKGLGLGLDDATVLAFASMVVSYVLGRSVLKAKK